MTAFEVHLEHPDETLTAYGDRLAFSVLQDPKSTTTQRYYLRALSLAASSREVPSFARALTQPSPKGKIVFSHLPQETGRPTFFNGRMRIGMTFDAPMTLHKGPLSRTMSQIITFSSSLSGKEAAKTHTYGVLVPDGADPNDVLYERLLEISGTPLLREWIPAISGTLDAENRVIPWETVGSISGFDLQLTDPDATITRIVTDLLKQRRITLPQGRSAPDTDISAMTVLDTYMLTFGRALGAGVLEASPALHTPGTAEQPTFTNRQLYQAQADSAEAVVKTWGHHRTAWLIGEQGVGKTTIALVAARERAGEHGRILVHVPGHLVPKWIRETKSVLPDAEVSVIRTYKDALRTASHLRRPRLGLEIFILPRDAAKLAYQLKPAAVLRKNLDGSFRAWHCPECGQALRRTFKDHGKNPVHFQEDAFSRHTETNDVCPSCHAKLWQADPAGPRREAPSRILSRRLKPGAFDVLVADEIHEEKGDTLQGDSLGRLLRIADRSLFMTGTLLGGKASDLYYHLFRSQPRRMKERGYRYHSPTPFVATYGRTEKRIRTLGSKTTQTLSEQPGLSPAIYADFLMESAIFLGLEDLEANLPPYEEEVHLIDMAEDQRRMYESQMGVIRGQIAQSLQNRKPLSSHLQAAMALPDLSFEDADTVLPKEAALVAEALREKALGRRCLLFVEYTDTYDVSQRLRSQLEDLGLSTRVLSAKVRPEDRESWIQKAVEGGADVLICHPRLVATGLDLTDFPTILWAQESYSLFEIRQASRRSWRIGQTKPVRVLFYAYRSTAQETVLRVLGEKLLAAQAVEGRFSAEGLQAMGTGRNPALLLAHALVYGLDGLPELTDAWRVRSGLCMAGRPQDDVRPALDMSMLSPLPALARFVRIRHTRGISLGQQTLF